MTQMARVGLPLRETLLPQHLVNLGYSTHHIGKWHLGYYNESYLPTRRGYHSFFGMSTRIGIKMMAFSKREFS